MGSSALIIHRLRRKFRSARPRSQAEDGVATDGTKSLSLTVCLGSPQRDCYPPGTEVQGVTDKHSNVVMTFIHVNIWATSSSRLYFQSSVLRFDTPVNWWLRFVLPPARV